MGKQTGSSRLGWLTKKRKAIMVTVVIAMAVVTGAVLSMMQASKQPSFCAACHIMKPYYQSWEDSTLLASSHAEEGVTCHECHNETLMAKAQEGIKYVTGDYEQPLAQRDFSREKCLECHDDFDQVMASTDHGGGENPHAPPHSGEMECTMCHSMHHQSQVYCSQCHDFDWASELDESWIQ